MIKAAPLGAASFFCLYIMYETISYQSAITLLPPMKREA